jgi:hypothetical protein
MSATPDSTLANPEQRIADLERQLAECKAERDEALEQQTAITEVLRVISSSPGNLAPVFDTMLAQAMRLCDSGFGICSMFEDECFIQVAQRGIPSELWDVFPRRYRGSPGGSLERLIGGEAVVHVADLADSAPLSIRQPRPGAPRRHRGRANRSLGSLAPGTNAVWVFGLLSPRSPTIQRQTNRVITEFRRASGHRDGQRAAPDRDARGIGAADRDRRGIAGHQ